MRRKEPLTSKLITAEITSAEWHLIEFVRSLKWGSAEVTVQNSTPVLIKVAFKTIKLSNESFNKRAT